MAAIGGHCRVRRRRHPDASCRCRHRRWPLPILPASVYNPTALNLAQPTSREREAALPHRRRLLGGLRRSRVDRTAVVGGVRVGGQTVLDGRRRGVGVGVGVIGGAAAAAACAVSARHFGVCRDYCWVDIVD